MSVSDLMAGLLFVFILIVMVFAYELNRVTREQKRVVTDMTNAFQVRRELLEDVAEQMKREGIHVVVDPEHGILRIPEKILFASGSAEVSPSGQNAMSKLSHVLATVLPRYTGAPPPEFPPPDNENKFKGKVEAIFIEGHTDPIPLGPACPYKDNWDLSTQRAMSAYKEMMAQRAELDSLRNARGQPIFSVSGYADRRPVGGDQSTNLTPEGRAGNRRIDLRFIMTPPRTSPEVVEEVERRLAEKSKIQ
ncbi:MAG: OmpA family protein [Candidatus Eisenbacteria bacterium]|uniref:OmpA family protein n=1 Tax=Eiseniibacteriota bacterium TaxID=2212470 RepID=A0A948RWM8_UNCEI|nr:OmpA family protein [Candidatus Eisenbacteria bacterium]MBU1949122.1 OmpA family protein [Candidatus Eisenbacteria bacterium]MBU2692388.1 OmpA family protein [Candidatus Eisenbacteria bacterium]